VVSKCSHYSTKPKAVCAGAQSRVLNMCGDAQTAMICEL